VSDRAGSVGQRSGNVILAKNDDLSFRMEAADLANGLEAVHQGHAQVHDDDVGTESLRLKNGFAAIAGFTADIDVEHGG